MTLSVFIDDDRPRQNALDTNRYINITNTIENMKKQKTINETTWKKRRDELDKIIERKGQGNPMNTCYRPLI